MTLRSSAARLVPLVSDHVVHGRTIFPGAGYLEMARAAACATFASSATGAALSGVFFLQPLATEVVGLHVDCTFADFQFEVQSGVLAAGEGTLEGVGESHSRVHGGSASVRGIWEKVSLISIEVCWRRGPRK